MTKLSIRIDFGSTSRLGPGKVVLLERIAETGSIAAAGKSMGMSYRRAWELIAELNSIFGRPLVNAKVGGKNGGGTVLTPFGRSIVKRYRSIEEITRLATRAQVRALEAIVAPPSQR